MKTQCRTSVPFQLVSSELKPFAEAISTSCPLRPTVHLLAKKTAPVLQAEIVNFVHLSVVANSCSEADELWNQCLNELSTTIGECYERAYCSCAPEDADERACAYHQVWIKVARPTVSIEPLHRLLQRLGYLPKQYQLFCAKL